MHPTKKKLSPDKEKMKPIVAIFDTSSDDYTHDFECHAILDLMYFEGSYKSSYWLEKNPAAIIIVLHDSTTNWFRHIKLSV